MVIYSAKNDAPPFSHTNITITAYDEDIKYFKIPACYFSNVDLNIQYIYFRCEDYMLTQSKQI